MIGMDPRVLSPKRKGNVASRKRSHDDRWKINKMNEDVSPVRDGDFPASHVKFFGIVFDSSIPFSGVR